jgi:hypothetical protein
MSSVIISGDTSGAITLSAPAVAGTNTITLPAGTGSVVVSGVNSSVVSGTSVASTSGTSIDFTSIPSWVKRITVLFNGMSLNGNTNFLVQIGSGSITSSGYNSTSSYVPSGTPTTTSSTAGFLVYADSLSLTVSGSITLFNISGNNWVSFHAIKSSTTTTATGGGDGSLSGVLDRVRITSVNGTATFDAGSINILYE